MPFSTMTSCHQGQNLEVLAINLQAGISSRTLTIGQGWGAWTTVPGTEKRQFSKLLGASTFTNNYAHAVGLDATDGRPYLISRAPGFGWQFKGPVSAVPAGTFSEAALIGVYSYNSASTDGLQLVLIRADNSQPVLMSQDLSTWQWSDNTSKLPDKFAKAQLSKVYAARDGNAGGLHVLGVNKLDGSLVGAFQDASTLQWTSIADLPGVSAMQGAFSLGFNGNLYFIFVCSGAAAGLLGIIWQSHDDGTWHSDGLMPTRPGPASPIVFSSVSAAKGLGDNVGTLQVVGVGTDPAFPNTVADAYVMLQDEEGHWGWSGGLIPPLASVGYTAVECGVGNDGLIQVLLLDKSGDISLFFQPDPYNQAYRFVPEPWG